MVEYKGIEKVNAQALGAQRSLTEALWLTLQEQGIKDRTRRRVECFFVAPADSAAAALNGFPKTSQRNHEVSRVDDPLAPPPSRSFLHMLTLPGNFLSSSM
jgi:hypothetical protein